jgi:peptidoglycan/LPS O-acetylase OafA/YrhL
VQGLAAKTTPSQLLDMSANMAVHELEQYDVLPRQSKDFFLEDKDNEPVIQASRRQTIPERFRAFFRFLIPSFLTTQPPPTLHTIASLDGLRGYASFGVFQLHFTDTFCQMHNRGFGFDENNRYLIQLPFVHFLWTAPALVACFFVISGYVLSHKPIKQIRAQSGEPFLQTMSSAIFRRGIRLYLPTIFAIFVAFILVRVGAFNYSHWVFVQREYLAAGEDTPPIMATFSEQFAHWWSDVNGMIYPFHWASASTPYDPHLWTIPTEFQGSMLLFFVTIGVWNVRTFVRLGFVGALILYCGYHGQNDILLFFGGMFLAEVDLILREDEGRVKRYRYFWLILFTIGLYLAGMTSWDPEITPGYQTLMWLVPNSYRWHSLGCFMLVWSVRNSHDIQIAFTNRFAQYLGKISYSLYIVHGNVRRIITYSMMPTLLVLTNGKESEFGYAITILVSILFTYPITFFLADLFWRAIDIPSIKFAKWVETKCTRRS